MVRTKEDIDSGSTYKRQTNKVGLQDGVLADPTGYTTDFDLYCGATEQYSQHGQSYDVVMKLCNLTNSKLTTCIVTTST